MVNKIHFLCFKKKIHFFFVVKIIVKLVSDTTQFLCYISLLFGKKKLVKCDKKKHGSLYKM